MGQLTWSSEKSSRITSMVYEEEEFTLEIHFKRGGAYKYSNVSAMLYTELITAESIGKAFEQTIKANPEKYPHVKIK